MYFYVCLHDVYIGGLFNYITIVHMMFSDLLHNFKDDLVPLRQRSAHCLFEILKDTDTKLGINKFTVKDGQLNVQFII